MDRRAFLKGLGLAAVGPGVVGAAGSVMGGQVSAAGGGAARPNFLWISLEDISPDLGCYGDPYAITPNIDKLAAEGTRFDRAFTTHGVCAPMRSGTIMSYYASAAGTNPMRCKGVPPEPIRCFPEYLRRAGYYCTNNSKTDYQFDPPDTAWDESSNKAHWRNRPAGVPFFAVINLTGTHESRIRSPKGRKATLHDPAKAVLPPYYPDTPAVRNDWACYHDNLTETDKRVGQILADLEADGLAEDTIVWFWGDHGRGLPRAKRWIYDSGLHIPLLIRVPAKWRAWARPDDPSAAGPGTVNRQLVSSIDFGATMLSLAGCEVPEHMHGRPFLGPKRAAPRRFIYGARDRIDESYDLMRCVRDERWHYIWNLMPFVRRAMHVSYMDQMPTMQEMRRLYAAGKLRGAPLQYFEHPRPVEELYDTQADPHEVKNLAGDPRYRSILLRLRAETLDWMRRIGDVGLIPEPDFDMMKRPMDRYETTAAPGVEVRQQRDDGCVVVLTCRTGGSSIAYRIEGPGGTWKGTKWQVSVGPITVRPGQTLRAKGVRIGFRDSREIRWRCGDGAIAAEADTSREHWKRRLARTGLLDRLLAIKQLDFVGPAAREAYFERLDDPWGPVRYWAVVGLWQTCVDAASIARARALFVPLLKDESQSVPIAAAEALCTWGDVDAGLPVLVRALKEGPVLQTRLFAANALERLGARVRPARAELQAVLKGSNGYLQRVLQRVVANAEG